MAGHSVKNPGTKQTATAFSEYELALGDCFPAITEANGHEYGEVVDPPAEKARSSQKRKRKARPEEDITLANLKPYFKVLPLESAAKMFGVGRTTFKTRIREVGIQKWPFEKSKERNPVREIIEVLFIDDICHEMNYQGNQALDEIMQEFKDLI